MLPASTADVNPTTRRVTLTVPLRDGTRSVGDLIISISADDTIHIPQGRLLDLLKGVVTDQIAIDLRLRAPNLTLADLERSGVLLRYDSLELAIDLEVKAGARAVRSLQVSQLDPALSGKVVPPAALSGFVNVRSSLDYLHSDGGLQAPVSFIDGAVRAFGVVAEGEGIWQPGEEGQRFYRAGSRLVVDDRDRLVRWTAGDLQPLGRGFQALPEIAGVSVFRSYGVLEPQHIARPRGGRSFTLSRTSTVEVEVNGQLVRRLQLEAGNYDLRDFPFTQGSNDVRLTLTDDSGRVQVLNFDVFLDQQQLGSGLSEFGVYAGVLSDTGIHRLDYSDDPAFSAFFRRGMSERLTLGGNAQADRRNQMAGVEALWSNPLGTLAASVAVSRLRGGNTGHAALLTFQRLTSTGPSGGTAALNLFVERRSKDFAPLGILRPVNPFKWEAGGGYSRALSESIFAGIDGRYSRGRGAQTNIYNVRTSTGIRVTSAFSVTAEARLERDNFRSQLSGLLTASWRIGRYSNVRTDFDTRFDRARLSYSTFRGQGVGAYNIVADLDRNDVGSGVNVAANYFANRGEIGFSHFGTFKDDFGRSVSQRSSLRFGGSVGFADGVVSVGRPIYDSFAIVRGHPSLEGASIEVERTPFGHVAETGALGTALDPSLPAYIDRTIILDAPTAPVTADLGTGAFRVFPPYRAGYILTVGSANNVTAIGRLIDANGRPLSLVTGAIKNLAQQDAEPLTIFTNRDGRFGAFGLGPGRWQVKMDDEAASTFLIEVGRDAKGVIQVGELHSAPREETP